MLTHQVAVWSPWTKAPKQGSAVESVCPQTTLVSQYQAFVSDFVGTSYMWLTSTECVILSIF